jgi:hypothetical protein
VSYDTEIAWCVHVRRDPTDQYDNADIVLEWGWTADMTEAEIACLADDVPRGHRSCRPCDPQDLCIDLAIALDVPIEVLRTLAAALEVDLEDALEVAEGPGDG